MQLSAWRDSGQYLDYRGHKIFYRDEGQGPALLLIHGFPTSSWDWKKIWPALTEHYRCITLDMLGFGYSSKPRQEYLIFEQADIFEHLLDTLGVESAHLIAHDYGDTVAQELLSRQLDGKLSFSMRSLHLLNGGLFPETHRALLIQKLMLSPCGGLLARFFNRKKLEKNFRKIFGPDTPPSQQEIDDFWRLITHNRGKLVMHRLMDYMNQRRQYRERWVSALQQPSIPIRLTVGLSDPISGAHMVERYRELIPNPDIVELEDIGHYPNVEAPERIVSSITEFLRARVGKVS
ncbi:alpha/beta fold hydrolase [Microbulbifer sp. Q7]|uniref:alpha/beta fold hydrolase n=1 Tax=Microbulbifer sp. Q7 TaxID=1785091 RepID=UPI00082B64CC|nr:alpha/beta hydrolase [Microbulbifer sp. Q7]